MRDCHCFDLCHQPLSMSPDSETAPCSPGRGSFRGASLPCSLWPGADIRPLFPFPRNLCCCVPTQHQCTEANVSAAKPTRIVTLSSYVHFSTDALKTFPLLLAAGFNHEKWNISCHISKQRMAQSSAFVATTGEPQGNSGCGNTGFWWMGKERLW